MTSAVQDPADPDDGAWCDALLGLDGACRVLAALLDGPGRATPAAAARGEADLARPDDRPGDRAGGLPDDLPDDLIDALLGLVSLGTTIGLVLDAARGAPVDAAPAGAADWSRELLR